MLDEAQRFIIIMGIVYISLIIIALSFKIANVSQSPSQEETYINEGIIENESEKETSVETNINTETETKDNKEISTPLVIGLSILYAILVLIIGIAASFYGVIYTLAKETEENQLYEERAQ